jgi:hypothetical protein
MGPNRDALSHEEAHRVTGELLPCASTSRTLSGLIHINPDRGRRRCVAGGIHRDDRDGDQSAGAGAVHNAEARADGGVGGVTSLGLLGSVVTVMGSLIGDRFPPKSRAWTVKV